MWFETHVFLGRIEIFLFKLFVSVTQSVFTCSKLTIEALEQGMKYIQS